MSKIRGKSLYDETDCLRRKRVEPEPLDQSVEKQSVEWKSAEVDKLKPQVIPENLSFDAKNQAAIKNKGKCGCNCVTDEERQPIAGISDHS